MRGLEGRAILEHSTTKSDALAMSLTGMTSLKRISVRDCPSIHVSTQDQSAKAKDWINGAETCVT